MTLEYSKSTMTFPQILVNQEQDDFPLGSYGCELLKYMKKNHPDRYWELNFNGKLMKTIHTREIELMDLKIKIMEETEKKFPRPITENFLEIASHMDLIDEQAETIIKQELLKPI
ncbi:MAG: TnpV protein [Oscillospiraceae bacterium]